MLLSGRIWFIAMALTVTVFVQFAAIPAQAHVGHVLGHARGIEKATPAGALHSVSASAHRTNDIVSRDLAAKSAAPTDAAQADYLSAGPSSLVSDRQLLSKSIDPSGCATGCCSDCMACFVFTFNEAPHDLAPVKRSIRIRLASLLPAPGIKPEALRKPPRDFV